MSLRTRRITKLYISDNALQARILAGQIEILREILSALRQQREVYHLTGDTGKAQAYLSITRDYSERLTVMNRERLKLETEK